MFSLTYHCMTISLQPTRQQNLYILYTWGTSQKQILPWQLEADCKCYFWGLENESYSFIQTKIVLPGTQVTQLRKKKKKRNHSCIKPLFKSHNYLQYVVFHMVDYRWHTTLMTQIGKWTKKVGYKTRMCVHSLCHRTELADHLSTSGCSKISLQSSCPVHTEQAWPWDEAWYIYSGYIWWLVNTCPPLTGSHGTCLKSKYQVGYIRSKIHKPNEEGPRNKTNSMDPLGF